MPLSAQEYADKLISRTRSASEDYKRGIQNTTKDPMALAAAAKPKMLAKVTDAINSGKWERGLQRGKASWKQNAMDLGASRLGAGVEQARSKIEGFAAEFLPFQSSVTDRVRQMPSNTIDDGIARAVAQIKGTAAFKRSR